MTVPANFVGFLLLFAVAMVSSVLAHPWAPVTVWSAINLAAFLGAAWAVLAVHEGAHAIAGRVVGLSVRSLRVGVGPRVAHGRVRAAEIDLRAIPDGGEVTFSAPSIEGLRWRMVVAYLAAPALHVLLFVLAAVVLGGDGLDDALSRPWQSTNAALAALLVVNGAFALNAIPFEVRHPGGAATTTDALRVMRLFTMGRDEQLRLVALHHYDECRALIRAERGDEAAAMARELLQENRLPELVVAVKWMYGTALLSVRRYAEAREVLRESLGPPRPAGGGTALALSNAAWASLMTGDTELLDEADALSREALHRDGDDASIAATRGTVLLKMGRTSEAAPLLAQAWRGVSTRRARAYRAAAMAIVAARGGREGEARARLEDARGAWPECDLLAWADAELATAR
jgi:tetratricopeptide (TPR) repeat protein